MRRIAFISRTGCHHMLLIQLSRFVCCFLSHTSCTETLSRISSFISSLTCCDVYVATRTMALRTSFLTTSWSVSTFNIIASSPMLLPPSITLPMMFDESRTRSTSTLLGAMSSCDPLTMMKSIHIGTLASSAFIMLVSTSTVQSLQSVWTSCGFGGLGGMLNGRVGHLHFGWIALVLFQSLHRIGLPKFSPEPGFGRRTAELNLGFGSSPVQVWDF